ncbi:MAG: 16S rRNA (uracil(1498)-N(3))-methyltransferase [candidate division Zixibacteria bacterium]|nr:16S rRNA (uracil(1498)-N(3))-methyltransferase [candidate division Zixibacteria bacterium]
MITYFYVEPKNVNKNILKIEGEEAKHICQVLRKGEGEIIEVVDGEGIKYQVLITNTGRDWVQGKILAQIRKENEPLTHLTLAQGLIKGVRMDFLVEKITEIGVSSIIPLITEKSVVKLEKDKREIMRLNRWKKIAISGMKQSLRSKLPEIQIPILFQELLAKVKEYDLALIACQTKRSIRLRRIKGIIDAKKRLKNILLLVGSESGFTQEELDLALKTGVIPISLGPRRLRSETAGIVFSSLLLYELEDLG